MSFKDLALPLASRGVPCIPLLPRTKRAFSEDWPVKATIDAAQLMSWDSEYPDANVGCVGLAQPGGIWFFEIDDPAVVQKIETDTNQKMPLTFRVRSRPGRGHMYFKHTTASIDAAQSRAYYSLKTTDGKESCSARLHHAYVVGPGSIHPDTGVPYTVVSTADIAEAPDWLISWVRTEYDKQQRSEKGTLSTSLDGPEIPHGSHNIELTRIAGKLRQELHLDENDIFEWLVKLDKRFVGHGSDWEEMCHNVAHSIAKRPIVDTRVYHNGVLVGPKPAQDTPMQNAEPEPEVIARRPVPYPKFPTWVMPGTSIYDGFVKPFCDKNCRQEEFMFMPAMALLLNYLGTKVCIEGKRSLPLSIYMVLIGKRGRLFKSASVRDAMNYFTLMGILDQAGGHIKTADSKTLIWTAGSPEGFLLQVDRTKCKNAVLFYDELSTLTNKASIDTSTMVSNILSAYEGAKLQNAIKSGKDNYSIEPGTYCISIITCSTDQNFRANWSRMAGDSTGLDDRFFFLFQPSQFKPLMPFEDVNVLEGALETRRRIDAAVARGAFKIADDSPLKDLMHTRMLGYGEDREEYKELEDSARMEQRAEKWALAFAVDKGLEEIDIDCIERGLALVKYEADVKRWVQTFEAETREGNVQQQIIHHLEQAGGKMLVRDMERAMHSVRLGTALWSQCYMGLIKCGWMREEGAGTRSDPRKLIQLKQVEHDND